MKLMIDISEELYAKVPTLLNKGNIWIGDILDAVKNGTPLEAQPTDDIKEAYLKGYDYGVKDWFKAKTQPCENCVSRKALEQISQEYMDSLKNLHEIEALMYVIPLVKRLLDLPSVYPERPKGKWIGKYISGATDYEVLIKQWQIAKCNKCGKEYKTPYTDCKFVDYAYCPYCGSYNGGREDENNTGC